MRRRQRRPRCDRQENALRTCSACSGASVGLRGGAGGPLEAFCERVCHACGAVLGAYAGTAAERLVRLWRHAPR